LIVYVDYLYFLGNLGIVGNMPVGKDVKNLIKEIEKLGYDVIMGGNGHWKVYRGSSYITSLPATPSDQHSLFQKRAQLQRLGVPVAGRKGIK
jgi:hypothetical protein